ncbi:hypothetical protein [Kibdelosporangium philippinense]
MPTAPRAVGIGLKTQPERVLAWTHASSRVHRLPLACPPAPSW